MINIENKKMVLLIILFICFAFAGEQHPLKQYLWNWPAGYDTTGAKYFVYDIISPCDPEIDVLTETSTGSFMMYSASVNVATWNVNLGNFPDPPGHNWSGGDTVIAFGSWDSAYVTDSSGYGDNVNHTGFYWLFSDTIIHDEGVVDTLLPADTLRVMPEPYAYQVGGETGNIRIEIINPAETRRVDQTEYDVMGFWIWADTTGAGTPDAFNDAEKVMEVGFFSVDGDAGDITICTDTVPNYHDGHTVYWAYKLVARPDTVDAPADTMGYSTYYFSQNSNPIVIIGIEENSNSKPECIKLEISPNPFTDRTDIKCSMGHSAKSIELKIFDVSGRLIRDFPIDLCNHNKSVKSVRWYGTDESGKLLPSGVYFVQAKNGDLNLTKKVILQR